MTSVPESAALATGTARQAATGSIRDYADSNSGSEGLDQDGVSRKASKRVEAFAVAVVWPYAISFLLVGAALVSTLALRSFFPYPFLFLFFAAVMASAWMGQTGPGLFSVLLSTIAVDYFFVPPFDSFAVNATDTTYFVAFILCALAAHWVSASKKRSEEALKDARDQLEFRVAQRTAELRRSNRELSASIQEQEKAQQALMTSREELAHLSRVLSMGELTSSIAHEINQPLTAVVTYGNACVEWLSADPPNLDEARRTAENIIRDGTRAGAILSRIRRLFKKEAAAQDWVGMNEVVQELIVFLRSEAARRGISLRTDLYAELPQVMGDRVQLQQVVLNLILNSMDAMKETSGQRPCEIIVRSCLDGSAGIRLVVEDSGVGLSEEIKEEIFRPFFTTKAHGIGMGLSISRSIVESHAGHLWAESRPDGGASFQFTIPCGG